MNSERSSLTLLAVVFLIGGLSGAWAMHYAEHDVFHPGLHKEYSISQHEQIAAHLARRLKLSPKQQKQVDVVVQQTYQDYNKLEDQVAPQFDQVREQGRNQLRGILTQQQRQMFENMVQQVDRKYPLGVHPALRQAVMGSLDVSAPGCQ